MRAHAKRYSAFALAPVLSLFLAYTEAAFATEKGWYLGFSVGQSELVDKDSLSAFCNELFVVCGDKKSDTAFKGVVGYQINNYVAVEGAYFDLGSPSLATEAPIVVEASASMNGGSFSLLPQIPISNFGAVFGRLGIAAGDVTISAEAPIFETRESDSTTAGTILIGAGAAINLGRNVTIRAEWERYAFDETLELARIDVDSPDVDFFSASIVFRFPKD